MNLKSYPTPVTRSNKGSVNLHYVLIKDPENGSLVGAGVSADLEQQLQAWRELAMLHHKLIHEIMDDYVRASLEEEASEKIEYLKNYKP